VVDNPIDKIEDKSTWMDFGRQGYFILAGAMEEGASFVEAMHVASAFYAGLFSAKLPPAEDQDEDVP